MKKTAAQKRIDKEMRKKFSWKKFSLKKTQREKRDIDYNETMRMPRIKF